MTDIWRPSSVAVVNQIWLSQTTGEDQPRPGVGTFQRMFSVSLQRVGRGVGPAWPFQLGPRKSGQRAGGVFSAAMALPAKNAAPPASTSRRVNVMLRDLSTS